METSEGSSFAELSDAGDRAAAASGFGALLHAEVRDTGSPQDRRRDEAALAYWLSMFVMSIVYLVGAAAMVYLLWSMPLDGDTILYWLRALLVGAIAVISVYALVSQLRPRRAVTTRIALYDGGLVRTDAAGTVRTTPWQNLAAASFAVEEIPNGDTRVRAATLTLEVRPRDVLTFGDDCTGTERFGSVVFGRVVASRASAIVEEVREGRDVAVTRPYRLRLTPAGLDWEGKLIAWESVGSVVGGDDPSRHQGHVQVLGPGGDRICSIAVPGRPDSNALAPFIAIERLAALARG